MAVHGAGTQDVLELVARMQQAGAGAGAGAVRPGPGGCARGEGGRDGWARAAVRVRWRNLVVGVRPRPPAG